MSIPKEERSRISFTLLSARDKYNGESYDYKDWVTTFDLSVPPGVGIDLKNITYNASVLIEVMHREFYFKHQIV